MQIIVMMVSWIWHTILIAPTKSLKIPNSYETLTKLVLMKTILVPDASEANKNTSHLHYKQDIHCMFHLFGHNLNP